MQQLLFFGSDSKKLFNSRLKKQILNFNAFKETDAGKDHETIDEIAKRLEDEFDSWSDLPSSTYSHYSKCPSSKGLYSVIQPQNTFGRHCLGEQTSRLICLEEDWKIVVQDMDLPKDLARTYLMRWQETFNPLTRTSNKGWDNLGVVWEEDDLQFPEI